MTNRRCPGQDLQNWKPEDIYNVRCPFCHQEMEFWKDDPFLICPHCHHEVRNPKFDLGCAQWCQYADDCLGILVKNRVQSDGGAIDKS